MTLHTIIIPARNEQENIKESIGGITQEFQKHNIDYEIIVIDDGSIDNTFDAVNEIAATDKRIHAVKNQPPYGFGNAIKTGLKHFKGDYAIITMADASDDPRDMVRYIREVGKGYDCCFGTRWHKDAKVEGYPPFKLILNRFVNWWISVLFQLDYKDVTNAFKCYSRETIAGISPILSHHFNITVEMPLKAIVRGYRYQAVPTHWYQRRRGKTNLKFKEMGSRYLFIVLYILLEKWLCASDYRRRDIRGPS